MKLRGNGIMTYIRDLWPQLDGVFTKVQIISLIFIIILNHISED